MRRRWVIEAEYPDRTRASAVDFQLQAMLDVFTAGRAQIVEAYAIEQADPAEAGVQGAEADPAGEVLRPVLHVVPASA